MPYRVRLRDPVGLRYIHAMHHQVNDAVNKAVGRVIGAVVDAVIEAAVKAASHTHVAQHQQPALAADQHINA